MVYTLARKKMTCATINKQLKLEDLDISLSCLRITRPVELERMQASLDRIGQLSPVIVRKEANNYQLLDGFKRYVHKMIMQSNISLPSNSQIIKTYY